MIKKKKILCKPGIAGNFFNLINGIYEKLTDNIAPGESFPSKIRNKQGYTFSPLLFNIFLRGLSHSKRQEIDIKDILI